MAQTLYVAREPDASGFIDYTADEHAVWNTLITRQMKIVEGRACQEYLDGIEHLGLPLDRIPQLGEINKVLGATTGWQVERVPALIPFQTFLNCWPASAFRWRRSFVAQKNWTTCRNRTSFMKYLATARC